MNNKIHLYGSYYLGNPRSFRSLVPEKGEDQIYILIINHSIVLSFANSMSSVHCLRPYLSFHASGSCSVPACSLQSPLPELPFSIPLFPLSLLLWK